MLLIAVIEPNELRQDVRTSTYGVLIVFYGWGVPAEHRLKDHLSGAVKETTCSVPPAEASCCRLDWGD